MTVHVPKNAKFWPKECILPHNKTPSYTALCGKSTFGHKNKHQWLECPLKTNPFTRSRFELFSDIHSNATSLRK
jgi:hypothetical protein